LVSYQFVDWNITKLICD